MLAALASDCSNPSPPLLGAGAGVAGVWAGGATAAASTENSCCSGGAVAATVGSTGALASGLFGAA